VEELQLEVRIDPDLTEPPEGALTLGDPSRHACALGGPNAYDDVEQLYVDLILGREVPLLLASRGIETLGHVMLVALFLRRGLALHPRMHQLVVSTALADRYSLGGLAHVERDIARFLLLIQGYVVDPQLGRKELGRRLATLVEWVDAWVEEDRLPQLPVEPDPPVVIDHGTNGFVVAETTGPLEAGWLELYRQGYLRGILVTAPRNGRRGVLAARKSRFVAFDLAQAARLLTDVEASLEGHQWSAHHEGLWMAGPVEGTELPIEAILKVLIRV
jgi:hypothetical protein